MLHNHEVGGSAVFDLRNKTLVATEIFSGLYLGKIVLPPKLLKINNIFQCNKNLTKYMVIKFRNYDNICVYLLLHNKQLFTNITTFNQKNNTKKLPKAMKHNYLEKLSKRELSIAGLTAKGFSAKEVADRLHISPLTVQTHIRNIYQKCGARKISDLTRYYILSFGDVMPATQQAGTSSFSKLLSRERRLTHKISRQ